MAGEARTEFAEADRLLSERTGYAFVTLTEAHEGIFAFDYASANALAGKADMAMHWLERAWNACWNDYPSLLADPASPGSGTLRVCRFH